VEEAAQLLTVNAGLECLHQLDDKRLLITDVNLFVRHFRLLFSRARTSRWTGVPWNLNSSRSRRFKKRK
jgi:hypothetical protein